MWGEKDCQSFSIRRGDFKLDTLKRNILNKTNTSNAKIFRCPKKISQRLSISCSEQRLQLGCFEFPISKASHSTEHALTSVVLGQKRRSIKGEEGSLRGSLKPRVESHLENIFLGSPFIPFFKKGF